MFGGGCCRHGAHDAVIGGQKVLRCWDVIRDRARHIVTTGVFWCPSSDRVSPFVIYTVNDSRGLAGPWGSVENLMGGSRERTWSHTPPWQRSLLCIAPAGFLCSALFPGRSLLRGAE